MNRDEFEGKWHEFKGKIKEKWGKFTDDDITRINGKYEQFLGDLQKKYGYQKEQAEKEFSNWNWKGDRNTQSGHQESQRNTHGHTDEDRESSSFDKNRFDKEEKSGFKNQDTHKGHDREKSTHNHDDPDMKHKSNHNPLDHDKEEDNRNKKKKAG